MNKKGMLKSHTDLNGNQIVFYEIEGKLANGYRIKNYDLQKKITKESEQHLPSSKLDNIREVSKKAKQRASNKANKKGRKLRPLEKGQSFLVADIETKFYHWVNVMLDYVEFGEKVNVQSMVIGTRIDDRQVRVKETNNLVDELLLNKSMKEAMFNTNIQKAIKPREPQIPLASSRAKPKYDTLMFNGNKKFYGIETSNKRYITITLQLPNYQKYSKIL